jgi:tRNA (cmo5U34)-methyltransferase
MIYILFSEKTMLSAKKHGQWVFDKKVAARFTNEAEQHIPLYWQTIDLSIETIKTTFDTNAKILEIGCATGNTLLALVAQGFKSVVGCDSSPSMIEQAYKNIQNNQYITLIETAYFPQQYSTFDVVICNWTLHFIKEREEYIQNIFNSLSSKGLLILTEKTIQSDAMKMLYHNFKLKQGLTLEQIEQKERNLEGVLVPYSLEQNLIMLKQTGFINLEILSAAFGFVTFLAWKP